MQQPIAHPCPHCGSMFSLTPEYLAQYGGQVTQCTNCRGAFTLPAAAPMAQGGPPPIAPMTVLPYAGPAPASGWAWCEGRTLVTYKEADVGHCCIKCGGTPAGSRLRKTFYWHEPWVYIIILAGLLPYVIVAMCVRKSGSVHFALCERHRGRRKLGILMGIVLMVGPIGLFVLAANVNEPVPWVMIGIVSFFTGLIWALLATRSLTPAKIDDHYLWLKGAGAEFLRTLPAPQAQAFPAFSYPPGRV